MIQLQILSGKKAGTRWSARRFPVRIGRGAQNDLQLEEPGIWDDHLVLSRQRHEGITLTTCGEALATVNQTRVDAIRLRNGDSIEIGSVQMRLWLDEVRQRGLRLREWFVWTLVAAVSVGEIALIYWLLQHG